MSGCMTKSNYKVLSFLFDGVPDPEKAVAAGKKEGGKTAGNPNASVHGPYAAKLCEGCHDRSTNRLVRPLQELCVTCHDIQLNKKFIHGPLTTGGCRVCHFPHSSPNRFLLVSDSKDFCFYCHTRSDFERNPAHEGADSRCILCHEPHMSDTRYLLR